MSLMIVKKKICLTHHVMIIHHHTRFGKKWLSGSEDISRTRSDTWRKYHQDKHSQTFWTFAVTLTLNAVIPFFHSKLWLMMLCYQTKCGCQPTSSLEDTTEIVIFWLYKPLLLRWHWTQWNNFSAWYSGLWCCITLPGLVTKCSDIIPTNIH